MTTQIRSAGSGRRSGGASRVPALRALAGLTAALAVLAAPATAYGSTGWSILPTPNTSSSVNVLLSVSCSSGTACTAVGLHGTAAPTTLAARWNGSQWTVQATPHRVTGLFGVSCPAARWCVAVGGTSHVLAERWDGNRWSGMAAPTPRGATEASLSGVWCSSPRHCVAVGFSSRRGDQRQLAELWDGTRWVIQRAPSPPGQGTFSSVSCSGPKACTAVGNYLPRAGADQAFAERWDGRSWSVQHAVSPPGGVSLLLGVSCPSAASCTAVGYHSDLALAERWDGARWAVASVPAPTGLGSGGDALVGVWCRSDRMCVAAGHYNQGPGPHVHALAERWTGARWVIEPTPSPPAPDSELSSVTCPAAGTCLAVGDRAFPASTLTLAERSTSE